MNNFVLTVKARKLIRALKRLCKLEKSVGMLELAYGEGTLTISRGGTSEELDAMGEWPDVISVTITWATALTTNPILEAVLDLRVHDGKLFAGRFGADCTLVARSMEMNAKDLTESASVSKRRKPR
jgi:hypothetical protein